jgi:hypothetical protein
MLPALLEFFASQANLCGIFVSSQMGPIPFSENGHRFKSIVYKEPLAKKPTIIARLSYAAMTASMDAASSATN